MSSKIEQLIDEIEEYIDSCKYQALSNTKIIVNKEEIDELLRELRMKTPDEIKRYQKIISNKEAILNDAKDKAQELINEATVHTNELINEHQIMQQAYAQANEIVTLATQQAQEILDQATMEANEVKNAAMEYTDQLLGNVENIISHSIDVANARYENLVMSLKNVEDIVKENREALNPPEEEETEEEAAVETNSDTPEKSGQDSPITIM